MKLTFFGDVYLSDESNFSNIDLSKYAPYVFNFEYAHYGKEHPHALGKILLKSTIDISKILHPMPSAVDINNNHIFDYADAGLLSTMQYLDSLGIPYFGAGTDDNHCNNPCVLEINEKKVAILGYYHRNRDKSNGELTQACFNEELFQQDVKRCRALDVDRIISCVHWGVEDSPVYTKMQQRAAHFMIDNGADLIIGHHPHCIQPWETYQGKYIFYSLGNFLFDDIYTKSRYTDETHYACMNCKRWHNWHRHSLGVSYDLDTGDVSVNLMYQKKHTLEEKKISSLDVLEKYQSVRFSTVKTLFRKVISSFSSFFFFHGHIFYWPGFREEMKLLIQLHIKNKNWSFSE